MFCPHLKLKGHRPALPINFGDRFLPKVFYGTWKNMTARLKAGFCIGGRRWGGG